MSRLVLTGATGFLGQALLDELEAHGELAGAIALCRRPAPELERRRVDVRVGSLNDPVFVRSELPKGCRIIHMAGQVEFTHATAQAMHELHVETSRILGRAAIDAQAERFVLLSSSGTSAVSPHPHEHQEDEVYPMGIIGRWPYYLSKMLQERLVMDLQREEGLPAVSLNPSLLLGPGDKRGGSTSLVADFLMGRIRFAPAGGISIVDVRDVAKTIRTALTRGRIGERYFLGSLNCRFSTFFRILEPCSGVAAPALAAPKAAGLIGAQVLKGLSRRLNPELAEAMSPQKIEMGNHFWYVDWRKAAAELDFRPRPPEETLRDTVSFLRAQALVKS